MGNIMTHPNLDEVPPESQVTVETTITEENRAMKRNGETSTSFP
jgi:hypothetical protein